MGLLHIFNNTWTFRKKGYTLKNKLLFPTAFHLPVTLLSSNHYNYIVCHSREILFIFKHICIFLSLCFSSPQIWSHNLDIVLKLVLLFNNMSWQSFPFSVNRFLSLFVMAALYSNIWTSYNLCEQSQFCLYSSAITKNFKGIIFIYTPLLTCT